jgi:hypothetical protein
MKEFGTCDGPIATIAFDWRKLMSKVSLADPPKPVHVEGMHKGEEAVFDLGREPGRGGEMYRTARDATSINAKDRAPILPIMPELPPA